MASRDRAKINTGIWGDKDFTSLSSSAQWLYLLRATQNQATRFDPEEAASYSSDGNPNVVLKAAIELADSKFSYILKRRSQRQSVPPSLRLEVFSHDNWQCVWCGSTEAIELDHIIPVSKGGGNERENLQTLCYTHNRRKGAKIDGSHQEYQA